MDQLLPPSTASACPASPVIAAARLAKTPLAIADAHAPGARILFANDAFGALLGLDPAALAGRPLSSLSTPPQAVVGGDATLRLDVVTEDGKAFAAALSTATVHGTDGAPMCLLCSLIDARGEGADAAIARDAELLKAVARAAGDLMKESGIAADAQGPHVHAHDGATRIAREAVERATHGSPPHGA